MFLVQKTVFLITILITCASVLNACSRSSSGGVSSSRGGGWFQNYRRGRVPLSDMGLTAPELIMKYGYPFESHDNVTTEDGYVLTFHRIPSPGRPVVIMFHGMSLTSRDFLINRKHKAPAYKMAEAGFDVWLVNARGNSYSRKHVRLTEKDRQFWDYTADDIIKYDAPAMIDYILKVTGESKVNWIGYSLGTAVGMGLTSTQPEYNQKIDNLILLGTVAYVGNTKSLILRLVSPFQHIWTSLLTTFNNGEAIPRFLFPILRTVLPLLSLPEASFNVPGIVSFVYSLVIGLDVNQINLEYLPILYSRTPGTIGIKVVCHWFQWINGGEFSYFDHGPRMNMQKYGTVTPPNYNLRNVTTRVINFYSDNDWLSVPEDVQRVVNDLPNVGLNIRISRPKWTHLDFVYGKDADVYVYDEIISAINMFSNVR